VGSETGLDRPAAVLGLGAAVAGDGHRRDDVERGDGGGLPGLDELVIGFVAMLPVDDPGGEPPFQVSRAGDGPRMRSHRNGLAGRKERAPGNSVGSGAVRQLI
jgi:hypothetical protein